MTKFTVRETGEKVDLTQNDFIAKGGEGSIYGIGDVIYKVCEPGKMIPEQKFQELSKLDYRTIIRPQYVLMDKKTPVGYTMRRVPGNAKPLAQIMTKSYRERENVTPNHMMNIVQQINSGLQFIHSHKGYLQVDGNEYNYMVTSDHNEVYFIDVNSFQTPSFPADAIMASIRDWHVAKDPVTHQYIWTQLSDWYSFAIISFYLFTAIHPFKGRHPSFTNMKTLMTDQMLACKSVLDPEVQFPFGAVYHPFEDVVPGGKNGAYMQWYRAVFIENKRLPAPKDFQATLAFVAKIAAIAGSNKFNMKELHNYCDAIVGFYEKSGVEVAVTKNHIHYNGKKMDRPAERFRVGFTPKNNIPYACWLGIGDRVEIQNLQTGQNIPSTMSGTDIMSCEGRVYVQSLQNIFEINFIENGNLIAAAKSAATIMPNATRLYQGVAVQDMFGTLFFSMFPAQGHHRQVKIQELNDYRITDAKYEHGILMVVASHRTTGDYSRFIFRFTGDKNTTDWDTYDVRVVDDITPTGINFTVLERGTCICITEDEKVEIFSNQKNSVGVKSIEDPAIDGEMKLCHARDQARFAKGNMLYEFSVRK